MSGLELNHYHVTTPKMVIDIGYLPAGVYFLQLITDNQVTVKKIIKK